MSAIKELYNGNFGILMKKYPEDKLAYFKIKKAKIKFSHKNYKKEKAK